MIPIKRNMDEEEKKRFHRECYECEKKDWMEFFHEQKYDKKYLNEFLVNSLKGEYRQELKEDGLL